MLTRVSIPLAFAAALMLPAAARPAAAAQQKQAQKKEEAKVVDPVCGMTVDPKTSEKAVHNGKTYYFCNRDERVQFEKSPEKYVARKKT